MITYIDNGDWYAVLLVAGGVFLGKVVYSILSGILTGIFKSFAKSQNKEDNSQDKISQVNDSLEEETLSTTEIGNALSENKTDTNINELKEQI